MGKKSEPVTAENVDDLTDEQIAELMNAEPDDDNAETTEANAAAEGADKARGGETDKAGDVDAEATQKAADDAEKAKGDDDDEAQKAESVPFKRYDYERNRRKQIEQEAKEERERWQKRFDELLKAQGGKTEDAGAEAKPDAIPDPDTDPMGAVRWAREQILARQQQDADAERQRQEAEQQQQASARMLQEANDEFAAAETGDPTVRQAYDALIASFQAEAQAYRMTPQQMQSYLQQTEFQHIAYARQSGIPLADYVKSLATARGWRPESASSAQVDQQQIETNKADAQRKAKTLSNGGGAPGVSDSLTADDILGMSDKEFDALIAKYGSVAEALAAQ